MTSDQLRNGLSQAVEEHEAQQQLAPDLEEEGDDESDAVWVVASRKEGSPHPFVEGVYNNEKAAEDHKSELTRNSFQHGVVAWGVFEQTVNEVFENER